MIYLPPLRRFLLPVLVLVAFVALYRGLPFKSSLPSVVIHQATTPPEGVHVPISSLHESLPVANASSNQLLPPNRLFFDDDGHIQASSNRTKSALWQPILDEDLDVLFQCRRRTNKYTGHIRLPNLLRNISQIPPDDPKPDPRIFWNPTVIALPHWSENQYLVVSRIVTDGNHQENVLCEANICYVGSGENATRGEKPCTPEDIEILGPAGGMRCAHAPIVLSVPPTPAEQCEGKFATYADIPGFHDPRIFWSGRGEPLMMCNTQYVLLPVSPFFHIYADISKVSLCMLWSLADRPARAPSSPGEASCLFAHKTLARSSEILPNSHRTDPKSSIHTVRHREELDALLPAKR